MSTFHAVTYSNYANVRKADEGITDLEWKHKVRVYPNLEGSELYVKQTLDAMFIVLNKLDWNDLFEVEDKFGNDPYKSTRVVTDKWDKDREIY